jgi:hypothetical protein
VLLLPRRYILRAFAFWSFFFFWPAFPAHIIIFHSSFTPIRPPLVVATLIASTSRTRMLD